MDVSNAYAALSPSSSRSTVSAVLHNVINAQPFAFDAPTRTSLVQNILADLKPSSSSRLTSKDAPVALLALKTLGKNTTGSSVLANPENLCTLLDLAITYSGNDKTASCEALRCIANALLLIENARNVFIDTEVNGGEVCVGMLEKTTSPDEIFILSRILFLCTASSSSSSSFIISLVESSLPSTTDIIEAKLDLLSASVVNGEQMAKEAMSDLLKFSFNLLLHYPKLVDCEPQQQAQEAEAGERVGDRVMGDFWSSKLDGLLPPLLRVFHTLGVPTSAAPPLGAPLTHVIHSLITIPITPALEPIWFASSQSLLSSRSAPETPSLERPSLSLTHPSSPSPAPASPTHTSSSISTVPTPRRTDSSSSSGSHSPTSGSVPRPSTLDRALSVLSAGRRSLSRSPSPIPPAIGKDATSSKDGKESRKSKDGKDKDAKGKGKDKGKGKIQDSEEKSPDAKADDVVARAQVLLDAALTHYLPGTIDPDDSSVRQAVNTQEGSAPATLDDLLSPLLVLLTRLALGSVAARLRLREWIIPANLDRTNPLEGRADSLGKCLRLMGSVYHSRLKDAVGELFFAICDSDATTLSSLLGYGNVAGFLFSKNIMTAPPAPSSSEPSSSIAGDINPITGTKAQPREPLDMTDEEKEREAEKLFVLFDRLERTGAIPPSQNPIRKAMEKTG